MRVCVDACTFVPAHICKRQKRGSLLPLLLRQGSFPKLEACAFSANGKPASPGNLPSVPSLELESQVLVTLVLESELQSSWLQRSALNH